jgi:hemolysin III
MQQWVRSAARRLDYRGLPVRDGARSRADCQASPRPAGGSAALGRRPIPKRLNHSPETIADIGLLGFGLGCAVVAAAVLLAAALARGGAALVVGASVYAAGLVAVFACSLLYRSATEPRRRQFFRRLDHAAIFAMIAGSATPFALARGSLPGALIAAALWAVAGFGIAFKLRHPIGSVRHSAFVYFLLGWISLFAVGPALSGPTVALIALGGAFYSAGIPFLVWWRRLPYRIAIWHGFVLAGAGCHYAAIMGGLICV